RFEGRTLPIVRLNAETERTIGIVRPGRPSPRSSALCLFRLAMRPSGLLQISRAMAAIGRFQKGDEIFYAKVVDGELFRLRGDVFGSPSFDKKPTPFKGLRTLVPVTPSKIIAVGLNYADHARESGKPIPK